MVLIDRYHYHPAAVGRALSAASGDRRHRALQRPGAL